MTTVFDIETIYKNAFYINERESRNTLNRDEIKLFCSLLLRRFHKEKNKSIFNKYKYKYIIFDIEEKEEEQFFMCFKGLFDKKEEDVYLSRSLNIDEMIKVNSRYSKEINEILNDSREIFSHYLSEKKCKNVENAMKKTR